MLNIKRISTALNLFYHKATLFISLLSLIFTSFGNIAPSIAQSPEPDFFFYYKDQKIPLTVSTEWIATDARGMPRLRMQKTVQASPLFGNFSRAIHYDTYMSLLPLKPSPAIQEVLQAAGVFKPSRLVKWGNPVFVNSQGLLILADEFIVAFPPAMPR